MHEFQYLEVLAYFQKVNQYLPQIPMIEVYLTTSLRHKIRDALQESDQIPNQPWAYCAE